MTTDSEWGWYVAQFEDDDTWEGPFLTRDEAVRVGLEIAREVGSETIYIAECRKQPVMLSAYVSAVGLLGAATEAFRGSDRAAGDDCDEEIFRCPAGQLYDLEVRLKRACDEWQARYGLVFPPKTFNQNRNYESIDVPPDAGGADV